MTSPRLGLPDWGIGVGLRIPHYRHVLETKPDVDCFEIVSENFMVDGGKPLYHLERVLEHYHVIPHGVSLGIGSPEPPAPDYLKRLQALAQRVGNGWLSDHFCWTRAGGVDLHDLLPLPATEEALARVVERAKMVQDLLGIRFALENTSSYMTFTSSTMSEWEFVSRVAEQADIGLLFDVNNVYVAAYNHGFDPYEYVNHVPTDRILQIHVAGHTNVGTHIIDTHTGEVIEPVWDLYRYTIERVGPVSTIIEWDSDIASFEELAEVAAKARTIRDQALAARSARIQAGLSAVPPLRHGAKPEHPPPDQHRQEHRAWEQGGPRDVAAREVGTALESSP